MKRWISPFLILTLLAALLTGCAAQPGAKPTEPAAPDPAGVYKLQSIDGKSLWETLLQVTLDQGYPEDVLREALQQQGYDPDHLDELITLTLEENGTASVRDMFYGTYNYEGSWTQEGTKITLVLDGVTVTGTLEQNVFTANWEDSTVCFARVP